MTEVDSKIDLVVLGDLNLFLVLHEDCDKLITDLRSMLCIVLQAELTLLFIIILFVLISVAISFVCLTFLFFLPPYLIKALSKEYDILSTDIEKVSVHFLRNLVEVKGEDLIDFHVLPVILC